MKIKNNDLWQRFFSSLANKLLRFRWLGIVTVVLLTVFFAFQMQGLKFDDSKPQDPEEMAEVREKALSEPTYVNSLISPDGQSAAIILEMEGYPEDGDTQDPKNEIAPAVREILARPEFAALNAYVAGGPIMHHDYDEIAARETRNFMGLCLLIQMVILLWVGRGARGVFVPISIVFLSVLWTMGTIGLMGFTLNMMIIILPSLLICVGIGDSMHFIAEYQDQCDNGLARRKAMLKTFTMVGLPCLLTTLTTMGAFLSFLTVRIRPFRYETSGGDQLDKLVSFDYDIARLTVKTRTLSTADVRKFMQDVEDFSRKTFDDSVSVEVTDALSWVKALNDKMGEGVKYSFTAVLFAVTALMMSFLRSVKLGLISMIPTVFPVLITLGLMGLAGIYLDMPLMCCSAVIIGVPWTIPYIFSGAIAGNSNVWATIRRPCGQRLARWDVRSPSPP